MSIPCAKHISDMLEDIQEHMMNKKPACKFVEVCAEEDWTIAERIADSMNKEVLQKKPRIFKDFVRDIKREKRLNFLIEDVK